MIKECLTNAIGAAFGKTNEGFDGFSQYSALLTSLLVLLIYVVIILSIGKWLWNNVLCSLLTIAKKATSMWEILGLAILLHLIKA